MTDRLEPAAETAAGRPRPAHGISRIIRVFISSPGDVAEEREKARQVLADLERQYPGVRIEPVLWEDLPLPASTSFQQGIDQSVASAEAHVRFQESVDLLVNQSPIDVAVFILWSRLGSPLGKSVTRPDGSPYRSGTEREFELMLAAFEQSGKERPVILAYVRDDDRSFRKKLTETASNQLEELIGQRNLAESFIREQFHDDAGHNVRAYHSYHEPVGFAQRLRTHLRPILDQLLGTDATARWTDKPYRSLEAFHVEHAPIFFGRDEETCLVLQQLRDQEQRGTAFVVIIGASGSGKSSLARAGVAATLAVHAYDEQVRQWRVVTVTPSLNLTQQVTHHDQPATLDTCLAQALAEQLPELAGGDGAFDDLAEGLARDPALTIKLALAPAFGRAAEKAGGAVRVLLVLDQLEELWTDRRINADDRNHFLAAIEALAQSGHVSVLATLRTDFYSSAQSEPAFARLKGERGHFDLLPPNPAALARLIIEPARLAGLRFERDEQTGRRLDELVLQNAVQDPSALPLLQYALAELYALRDEAARTLTLATYEQLGGVEGAIGRRAADTFSGLPDEARQVLDEILPLLVTIDIAGEQAAVRRRAPLADLTTTPARRQLTESLIAARFLTTDTQSGVAVAGLAHEALLRRWDALSAWVNVNREQLRLSARVEQSQQRWEQQARNSSLLLPSGLPLEEGRQLLAGGSHLLSSDVRSYIERSIAEHESRVTRARRQRRSALAAMTFLTVLAMVGGLIAWRQRDAALMNAARAIEQEAEAQRQSGLATANAKRAAEKEAEAQRNSLKATESAVQAREAENRAFLESKSARASEARAIDTFVRSNYLLALARFGEKRVGEAFEHLESIRRYCGSFEWHYDRRHFEGSDFTLYGHSDQVTNVAFSPDGTQLASASWDKTIKVWDAFGGAEIRTLPGHAGPVTSVAYSPDGTRLASASVDKTIKLWDASGFEIRTLTGHTDLVASVAFSPDGAWIASGSWDTTITLWDARTGEKIRTFNKHSGQVTDVVFSPDGMRLASTAQDFTIKLWDVRSGAEIRTITRNGDAYVAFSPDGAQLASGSDDRTIKLWDAHSGAEIRTLFGHTGRVTDVAFSPDGSRLASASGDSTVTLWDTRSGAIFCTLIGHTDSVARLAFSPDGARLASASADKTLKVWDSRTGEEARLLTGHLQWITNLAFSPEGTRLASASADKTIKLWNSRSGEELCTLTGHTDLVSCVAFSPNGMLLASASVDKTLKLWNGRNGEEIRTLIGHTGEVTSVAFSADGVYLASASGDKTLKLWDARSGTNIHTFTGHTGGVTSVKFSRDRAYLASASVDKTLKLWDAQSGAEIRSFTGHTESVTSVAFSPDGAQLASASADQTIKLWNTQSGGKILNLTGHIDVINDVAFSPDGLRLVSVSRDKTIKLWDARSGEEVRTLTGHRNVVTRVALSPDGMRLASASGSPLSTDQSIKLWDARDGAEFRPIARHTHRVTSVAFSPDGTYLASGSEDKTIKLWDVSTGAEIRTLTGHGSFIKSVVFSRDGANIYSEDSSRSRRAWAVETGSETTAPKEWPNFDSSARLLKARWLAIPNGTSVRLVDLEFKNDPDEKAYREFKAKLDPWWHDEQAKEAESEKVKDWYAAVIHLAWVLKARPDDKGVIERLHKADQAWREEFARREADAATTKEPENLTPVSTNPDDYLPPIVHKMLKRYPAPEQEAPKQND